MRTEGVVTVGGPPGQLRATLTIQGLDLEPDDISGRLKCLPDDSQRRGQPRKRGAPYKHGAWSITAVSDGQQSGSELVGVLLDRLPADSDVWDELRPVCQVSLDLYVYLTTENQDLVLSAEQVGRLSKMGAGIWVDMYVGSED
jgi:Domain of unknown function (DUF4279)